MRQSKPKRERHCPAASGLFFANVVQVFFLCFDISNGFTLFNSRISWRYQQTFPSCRLQEKINGDLTADSSIIEKSLESPLVEPLLEEEKALQDKKNSPICRVVTRSDAKFPTSKALLPKVLTETNLLPNLDAIYHAMAHDETRRLRYMDAQSRTEHDTEEEKRLVSVVRCSLEDAGFEFLSRRDIDLCEALNAGYLLRLSLLPDTLNLDPSITKEFFPERFNETGKPLQPEEFLFDGRVLVFWRGYSREVSRGRLFLPKIDYLQASVVQRSAAWIKAKLDILERWMASRLVAGYRKARAASHSAASALLNKASEKVGADLQAKLLESSIALRNTTILDTKLSVSSGKLFKLARYGGSKIKFIGSPNPKDALNPFIICEEEVRPPMESSHDGFLEMLNNEGPGNAERDMYEALNFGGLQCPYDEQATAKEPLSPMQLLQRVSLSSLVDLFSSGGRRALLKTLVSRSELVEPTYEEVVVVWRPLPKKEFVKPKVVLPKFVYDVAELFDIEGLPRLPKKPSEPTRKPLELRAYRNVPMANLPAVLPKTKLVFRPADALVFDFVSIASLLLVVGSLRFDSPRLDILAIISVILWVIRTVFRYSNKLARYDLLVKKFLTSKISHRNNGCVKYVANEGGTQRAIRAALVYTWLSRLSPLNGTEGRTLLERDDLVVRGEKETNDLLQDFKRIPVDIDAALNDLEDLNLVVTDSQSRISVVQDRDHVQSSLKTAWSNIFDGKLSLKTLVGRRRHPFR